MDAEEEEAGGEEDWSKSDGGSLLQDIAMANVDQAVFQVYPSPVTNSFHLINVSQTSLV